MPCAIWLIGQASQRFRWADLAYLKGRYLAFAGQHHVLLVVNQATAQNLPCQQTPEIGQTIQNNHERIKARNAARYEYRQGLQRSPIAIGG